MKDQHKRTAACQNDAKKQQNHDKMAPVSVVNQQT